MIDDLDRITARQITGGANQETFGFNQIGNITSKDGVPYTYGSKPHAVTNDGVNPYVYDNNGNMTQRGTGQFIKYNAENRPVKVSSDWTGTDGLVYIARFGIDGDGRRVKRSDNFGTVHYVGAHYERNVGTPDNRIDEITRYYHAQMGKMRRLVAMNKAGTLHYVFPDHLGSTFRVVDTSGNTVDDIRYHVFGATRAGGTNMPTDKRFTGQVLDSSTGLYFYNARYYDSYLNRWIQPDPIVPQPGNPQALNRYSYGLNNPIKFIDPTGNYVVFVGGVGTDNDPDKNQEAWGSIIKDMGLKEGEYEFFDWSAGGRYGGKPSDYRLLNDAAGDLAGTVAGKKDVTLIGHSKGGGLVLEYMAQVAEGRLAGNPEVNRAFILDSPTAAGGAWGARLPRYGLTDPDRSNLWDRMANLPDRVRQSTSGAMKVDVAMIANQRDMVSGPPIPGIPYFAYKAGNERFGDWPVVGGLLNFAQLQTLHGGVQHDPWVAGFINWYRR